MTNRPISWPIGGKFIYHNYGQKVWKFHGERSGDKMPGEELLLHPQQKQNIDDSTKNETRMLGRSCSTGSNCSSSESESSSQPSPLSETQEDAANEFLMPLADLSELKEIGSPCSPQGGAEVAVEAPNTKCTPPSPVVARNPVDLKMLSNLITVLLKKHTMVQEGLELLKNQPALALRLQQRRPRKVLADQGIIPPLKSPATYYEQVQKLERARKGDFLNKKMQDRPERDFLVQKHILEDTNVHDSIVAHQKELKKAKLVDDLNEKIYLRPGVFELVEKNILPAEDSVAEAIKGGHVQYKKVDDFIEEDSSDGFSPGQPFSQEQSTSPSFGSPPTSSSPFQQQQMPRVPSVTEAFCSALTSWSQTSTTNVQSKDHSLHPATSTSKISRSMTSTHTTAGHPYLFRQTSSSKSSKTAPSSISQRNVRKKKEKPKFRKLKYHQYVPPDQQGKSNESSSKMDMDTPYSRLLEQQQLYLQLQIMNHHYPTVLPATANSSTDQQIQDRSKNFHPTPPPAPPITVPNQKGDKTKRTFTVAQLEEMKVAELKEELKARSQKVTGTKEVLVERLKRFAQPPSKSVSSGLMSQPISQSITGLINATIQSTIRANTEQALAAAVGNNGNSGSLVLSPPLQQQNQDSQRRILEAQITPPPRFAKQVVGIQVVTSAAQQQNHFTMQQINQQDGGSAPMETQNQDHQSSMETSASKPSKFHFTTTSNGVQLFTTAPPLNTATLQGQVTSENDRFFNTQVSGGSEMPGQRVIATPSVQFKVDGAGKSYKTGEKYKDELLHKQQREIEDLRRMVELHRTQLHQIQEEKRKSKQDGSNNINASNSNHQSDLQSATLTPEEEMFKRPDISQVLQKHLQDKMNKKDVTMTNGLYNQMQNIKQEMPQNQISESPFNFSTNPAPPNVSLIPLPSSSSDSSHSPQQQLDADATIILSVKPPVERRVSENKDPPKYEQAMKMLRENPVYGSHENPSEPGNGSTGAMTNADMDDLLEILTNKGDIPITPDMHKSFPPQVASSDHLHHQQQPAPSVPQTAVHYQIYNPSNHALERDQGLNHRGAEHLHRTISANALDNITHRRSLELPALLPLNDISERQGGYQRKDPNLQRRHSGDLLSYSEPHTGLTPLFSDQNDFTSLLVSSAGDILMDSSRLPPSDIQGRVNYPNCMSPESVALQEQNVHNPQPTQPEDKGLPNAYLNLNDPYATQPFSPMDTSSSDRGVGGLMDDRVRDPHLSSSSIHDSESSLDKCLDATLPTHTGSYLRNYSQPLASGSRHSHLVKSSSQELLSNHGPPVDHTMQVDLNWLDLDSPFQSAPSPLHHQKMSMHGSAGSILDDPGSTHLTLSTHEPPNSFHLGGEGLTQGSNDFPIDLIDSLDLSSIGSPTMDDW